MGNSSDKKDKSPAGTCPDGCNPIRLKIDCTTGYPDWVPFPPNVKSECVTVLTPTENEEMRLQYEDQEKWKREYNPYYDPRQLPAETVKYLNNNKVVWTGKETNTGLGVQGAIHARAEALGIKKQVQMHHIQPLMLSGTNKAINYQPLFTHHHAEVHNWWDARFRQEATELKARLKQCAGANKDNKIAEQMERCEKKYKAISQNTLTLLSECLEPTKLCVTCKS